MARGVGIRYVLVQSRPGAMEREAFAVAAAMTESESLVFGTDFGIVTDIETGPSGLFVVSLDQGAVYEIGRR